MKTSQEKTPPQALYQGSRFYTKENESTDNLGLLSVTRGLTEKQVEQLIYYANTDEVVRAHSSDSNRFKDKKAYDGWLKKERSIYSMVDNKNRLLGIVWFGKSDFPDTKLKADFVDLKTEDYGITFALRIYDEARGNKIAKRLTAAAFTAYLASSEYQSVQNGGIWLETSAKNIAAVKTYDSLFTQVSDPDKNGKIIMILDPQ